MSSQRSIVGKAMDSDEAPVSCTNCRDEGTKLMDRTGEFVARACPKCGQETLGISKL
ncbi:hypothetical protein [Halobellus ordinarius]|uniref:hypothetical protein n=1 Tax=Halobellus ordinarius TaxID=3075120 RepID=UPI0028806358|nr:hypothetical protein [Halobellus sp. ZY16]